MEQTQTCLGLDLFEIVAELTDLDLEDSAQAAEAIALSGRAQRRLASTPPGLNGDQEPPPGGGYGSV